MFKSVLVTNIQKTFRSGPDNLISIARPAFAAAPRVKKNRRKPEACQIERSKGICYARFQWQSSICKENILTGLDEEKKSIILPTVKGTLIDTAEEINNSPTAMSNGFLSGLARAKILRKEETFCGVLLRIGAGRNRASTVVFLGVTFCWDEDWVELNLQLVCQILEDDGDGMTPKSVFCRKGRQSRLSVTNVCCLRGLENLGGVTPGSGGPGLGRNPRAQMPNMILEVIFDRI